MTEIEEACTLKRSLSRTGCILKRKFDGKESIAEIRCGGVAEATFTVKVNGKPKYLMMSTPHQREVRFLLPRYIPSNKTTISVHVESPSTGGPTLKAFPLNRIFWAEFK